MATRLRNAMVTVAYRRAGYKSKGEAAKANAARLIANDNVASAICLAMDSRSLSSLAARASALIPDCDHLERFINSSLN